MMRTSYRWALGLAGFGALLAYATLISLPDPPPSGVEHSAERAGDACVAAVAEEVEEPRFPFSANVTYLGEARYRLSGMVDAPEGREIIRRNYECVVRYTEIGSYRTDSLTLWQSH